MHNVPTKPHIGRRFLAGLIDYIFIYTFTLIMIFSFGETTDDGEHLLSGISALFPILLWLTMTVGFESGLGGTIGNSIFRLKVIPMNGVDRKLTFTESLKRRLLDPVDMFFFGVVAIVTLLNTEKNQRIGDLWAKTIVVSAG